MTVTFERWQRVKDLFEDALERGPTERIAFLAQACAGDQEIRQEVESLLAAHEGDPRFMNTPVGNLLQRDKPVLATGQRFGHYEEISPLGEGGMGQVYLAVDTRLQRQVALKLLPASFMHDADRVRRFGQEARAASALNHPNIITIHEIGETDSLHFIATEFVEGETLREHMTNTRMMLGEVLDVAVQVASALQAAHEAGIVHRDIKPENIMLRRDRVVKVLDFGLAKLTSQQFSSVDAHSQSMVQTNPGVVMGTVGYMSPEQARGQEVDARTDIWSLGVVLYEMIAGRAPFHGETPSHGIVSILENEPTPLSLDPEVPAELSRIVMKALCKTTGERYQTAGKMALDLKSLKEELTLEARLKQFLGQNAGAKELRGFEETIRQSKSRTAGDVALRTTSVLPLVSELKHHKAYAGAALLIVLLSVMGLTYSLLKKDKPASGAPAKISIAVLPLKPVNAVDRDNIYELGIAETLIQRLHSMKVFEVRQLSAIRQYADLPQDPIAAGKEQQVDHVLAWNYQMAGGNISITAQLFNVGRGQLEETYKIEKSSSDALGMQDTIAGELGNKLLAFFSATSSQLIAKRGTANEEAYRLYIQGMYLANNRNLEGAQQAVEALEQAVRLDPNYARAWAGLGYAHRTVSLYTGSVSTHETYQKSIEAINKALALDENLSEAHSGLCENKYLYEWDFAGAERECKRAIELDPDSSQAHEIFSRYLMGRARHDEAIAEIKTAIDLEPTSRFFHRNYGRALFYARRYPEAVDQFKRVVAMDKNFLSTYSWLTSALALQGNEAEAFEWFLKLLELRKVDEETVQASKTAFQTSGWHGVLREWLKNWDKIRGNSFDVALYTAQIGNKDKAFEYLEKMYQLREIWVTYLQVDPRLDNLRDDPRFADLVRRVESK